ncbi:putative six-hairpin glycosidase superfamily, beta-L-arabinofuranosidase, GH127 [Helianthus annuus]|nr:putative six-hairpin glycosidase superfamily, beta-L-arabinofuranosidase, GH127 [Helianthus annuus]
MKCLMFMVEMLLIIIMLIVLLYDHHVMGKECTNIPTQLSSHTFRYKLLNSNNKTWKQEMYYDPDHSHRHLTPTDESAWAGLLPKRSLKQDEFSWRMMYKKIKNPGAGGVSREFLNELPLSDVRLDLDSIYGQAQRTNLEYLLMLDVDRLVYSFRVTSGLPTVGKAYGGWESPHQELRGHFVGHYLSASAQMWASTGNTTLKKKMTAVVSSLAACQDKIGTGYLSAFPSEFFDRFEAIKRVWAPYYTIHKIMAGLVDQYVLAGNSQALKMVTKMADYFCRRVQNVITRYTIERHWLSLNEEIGGMNDVLYRLYTITGDMKHLWLAHLFDKPCFLGLLAMKADDISGYHANTHIPIVIGAQRRYEVTGDPLYKEIGIYFMDIVNSSHMYSTGGTSVREFWSEPKRLATTLHTENEESCTTYNMLKVSRNLFRWTKEMAYADYYERALTNSVLSIQRGKEPGVMIYMLPLAPGSSKAKGFHKWGSKFNDFWCCYGTGIESFSKLGDSIYFEEARNVEAGNGHGLYIIQYISSSADWKSGQVFLAQKVDPVVSWDPHLRVTVMITSKKQGASSTLKFRIPFWTTSNAKALLNGQAIPLTAPGTFLSVTEQWSSNDIINLDLPITLRMEAIQDDRPEYASLHAILYGPYLLVGLTVDDFDLQPDSSSLSDWIVPVPQQFNSQLISLSQKTGHSTLALSHINNKITMQKFPNPGSNSSVFATFRLVFTEQQDMFSQAVMLEPYSLPGSFLVHQGRGNSLAVDSYSVTYNSVFYMVNGDDGTVQLEAESEEGCFVWNAGGVVKLECDYGGSDDEFLKATSFVVRDGISQYDPVSFVAKGLRRNFLLQPLFSLRDEHYTVYFNINQ